MCIYVTILIKNTKLFDFLHPKEVHKNGLYIATDGFLLVLSFKKIEPNFRFHNCNPISWSRDPW